MTIRVTVIQKEKKTWNIIIFFLAPLQLLMTSYYLPGNEIAAFVQCHSSLKISEKALGPQECQDNILWENRPISNQLIPWMQRLNHAERKRDSINMGLASHRQQGALTWCQHWVNWLTKPTTRLLCFKYIMKKIVSWFDYVQTKEVFG